MDFQTKEGILYLAKRLIVELDDIEDYRDSQFIDDVVNAVCNNDTVAIETMLEELYDNWENE